MIKLKIERYEEEKFMVTIRLTKCTRQGAMRSLDKIILSNEKPCFSKVLFDNCTPSDIAFLDKDYNELLRFDRAFYVLKIEGSSNNGETLFYIVQEGGSSEYYIHSVSFADARCLFASCV